MNKYNLPKIYSYEDFQTEYLQQNDEVWETILEAFYNDNYDLKSNLIELIDYYKESWGTPQNPEYTFTGSFIYDNKVFYFDIQDGIGNGTEFQDVHLLEEDTIEHFKKIKIEKIQESINIF